MNPPIQVNRRQDVPAGAPAEIPFWKHVSDLVCLILALPFVLVAMLAISLLIKLVSTGPVLFKQERVGHRGRRFQCYKFRSMTVTSDQSIHRDHVEKLIAANLPMTKMDAKGDARLIPLGWLLRSTGLDELPQLINVARREMSLVGPRPCLPFEYDRYLPWQKERFNTLPGLTGLWQVSGKNHTTFVEMMHLDIHYSRHKTMWLDAKIILKTLPAVIGQTQETVGQAQARTTRAMTEKPSSLAAKRSLHTEKVTYSAAATTATHVASNH
jgi:lipopolysaccharide/colanic/teichoic acid biosynthesis glycosyltransferase